MNTPKRRSLAIVPTENSHCQFDVRNANRKPDPWEWKTIKGMAEHIEKGWGQLVPPSSEVMHSMVFGRSPFAVCSRHKSDLSGMREFYRKRLRGSVLFDLASGRLESYLAMANFAFVCGVSDYVAVDKYRSFRPEDISNIKTMLKSAHSVDKIDMGIHFVKEDILVFLAHQQDSSASICLSAFDAICIGNHEMEYYYSRQLVNNIARVVKPEGLAFGVNSPYLGLLPKKAFIVIDEVPGYGKLAECMTIKQKKQD